MFDLRLDDEDKNVILKLIGIIDTMSSTHHKKDRFCIDYNDVDGNQKITTMSIEDIDKYTEKVWNNLNV